MGENVSSAVLVAEKKDLRSNLEREKDGNLAQLCPGQRERIYS